ncbi:copper chaperone PCu(A)C [Rhizobium sp. BG4]|uniref:copper chaperone PCu(A)C n=1 Tax=Rhizobium sp. BG4 TaxID=2613770 RepID=UPI00193E5DAF|nr:copper chaperone PCu(A)C [Rhizobium sp. BG4]QRM44641.1 copper chaperone PCu(A)C [Rhizobium sp. BG4]
MKPLLLAIAMFGASTSALAHDFEIGAIAIQHPWIKEAPTAAPVVAAYLVLQNSGTIGDRFVGGSTNDAKRLEIHETTTFDGVAKMRRLTEGVLLGAGEIIELKPGGIHLMIVEPTRQFVAGEKVSVTLEFEKAGNIDVQFLVKKTPPNDPKHSQD